MKKFIDFIFGEKVEKTRVVPVRTKILFTFILIIIVSNLTSNYINLIFNRNELIKQLQELLVKDLRDIYNFAHNQYEIFEINKDKKGSLESIERKATKELKKSKSLLLGVAADGKILFQSAKATRLSKFQDLEALKVMQASYTNGQEDGYVNLKLNSEQFFAVYKFNSKWQVFIVRAEEENEFYSEQRKIFLQVMIIILVITLATLIIGSYLLRHILKYVGIITSHIMKMAKTQDLQLLDLKKAPNDDITFLGMAFNSLANTVNNLIGIFRKFANQDIVIRAYRDKEVGLEGTQKNLTIIFSDIRSFTTITETLGTDIIKLLNLHYDNAIRKIIENEGIIGAIIGDALLAVFGALEEYKDNNEQVVNKSLAAVRSAYQIQEVAEALRQDMEIKKQEIIKRRRRLTKEEERVYKAVLLQVGVGIDGGDVFYGTIGSYERMTNTVIGDNVNAASRLEGLTRIYNIPVIASGFVKDDIEKNVSNHGIIFVELDTVMVKGKTSGKKIYWPLLARDVDEKMQTDLAIFSKALELYYKGKWSEALSLFRQVKIKPAKVFVERISSTKCPKDWKGIWEMKSK